MPSIQILFLFLYEYTLLRNWNQSNRIIQTKVMAFSCQLVILPIFLMTVCITHFTGVLTSYFDTISLYSFKSKVLRVLFQLESPNSEHRNSRYVRNNPDYSMSKADAGIFLANGPTLSEFLGHLESEFDESYFLSFVLLEVYFNWPLESPKSDKK